MFITTVLNSSKRVIVIISLHFPNETKSNYYNSTIYQNFSGEQRKVGNEAPAFSDFSGQRPLNTLAYIKNDPMN